MTCHLLDCVLTPENIPKNSPKEWFEIYFIFAAIWGFGSSLYEDQQIDWRMEFSRFWISEFQNVQFPDSSCVFDYYVDQNTKQFRLWEDLVPKYQIDTDIPLQVNAYTRCYCYIYFPTFLYRYNCHIWPFYFSQHLFQPLRVFAYDGF